jgi:predicted kinase
MLNLVEQLQMSLILVCGPMGAGKTTYALEYARATNAIRFSIDSWMQTLYGKDANTLDYNWIMERVNRCHIQIWELASQVLMLGGKVILDLGFTTRSDRKKFVKLAKEINIVPELHCLSASPDKRRVRITKRNVVKDPELYAFEVTDFMFEFMEKRFESLAQNEVEIMVAVNLDNEGK